MAGQSAFLENSLLNVIRGIPYSVGTLYLSLHTADPAGTGANEVPAGAYQRVGVTFGTANGGTMSMIGTVALSVPAGVTARYAGLWDATAGGNFLIGGVLTTPVTFLTNGTLNLTSFTLNETL